MRSFAIAAVIAMGTCGSAFAATNWGKIPDYPLTPPPAPQPVPVPPSRVAPLPVTPAPKVSPAPSPQSAQAGHWARDGWQAGPSRPEGARPAPSSPSATADRRVDRPYPRMERGQRLPQPWRAPDYYVPDWDNYGLSQPAYGENWVRYYDDAALIDRHGIVRDYAEGIDWSRFSHGRVPAYVGDNGYAYDDEAVSYGPRTVYSQADAPVIIQAPYGATTVIVQAAPVVTTTTTTTYEYATVRKARVWKARRVVRPRRICTCYVQR